MNIHPKILIIDDCNELCDFIKSELEFCYQVSSRHGTEKALQYMQENLTQENRPEIVVLALKLQYRDGLDLLQVIRKDSSLQGTRVLVYSNSNDTSCIRSAFNRPGNDAPVEFLTPGELIARILTMRDEIDRLGRSPDLIACGNLVMNTKTLAVYIESIKVNLSAEDFSLLKYLIENKNRTISLLQLGERIWRNTKVSAAQVELYVSRLNSILQGFNHTFIATELGSIKMESLLINTNLPLWAIPSRYRGTLSELDS